MNDYHLSQLRHLYEQLIDKSVFNQPETARGLLGPAIENEEQYKALTELTRLSEDMGMYENELSGIFREAGYAKPQIYRLLATKRISHAIPRDEPGSEFDKYKTQLERDFRNAFLAGVLAATTRPLKTPEEAEQAWRTYQES